MTRPAPTVALNRTLGPIVCEWIEEYLCHGPGDVQGQRLQLDDEQVRFICRAYEIDDTGRRLVRRATYSRPKGRAKSELAAAIVCAEALGPVRFDGWDSAGMPVGKPVTSPIIPCVATEEGQADNTFGAAYYMLGEGAAADIPGLDIGLTRIFIPGGGKIHAMSAKASSKDGGKETFANFDETHLFITPELHRLIATIRRNLAKRKAAEPWSLETTTMYAPGQGSVAESSHTYAQAISDGKVHNRSFLFDHKEGPDPESFDFDDDDELREALCEAYGEAAEWMDLERLIAEARDPATIRSDFIRYFLNRPARNIESLWIKPTEWSALADPDVQIPEGETIDVGVDMALTNDSTAVVWSHKLPDGRRVQRCRVWAARPDVRAHVHVPGGRIRIGDIEAHIRGLAERYRIASVVYDPRFFEKTAQDLDDDGFTMVELVQSSTAMLDAYQDWYTAVTTDREIVHDGDPVFAAHVTACVAQKTDRGWKVRKLKSTEGGPGHRIDALVASVMVDAGTRAREETSPYESKDLLVL
jgi:phage terminase large subunit-like protein